jgi:hypothetical protein
MADSGEWAPFLRAGVQVLVVVLALALPSPGHTVDLNGDGVVDQNDLNMLLTDRNKSVSESVCGQRCDLDEDGKITARDARKLALLCTFTGCAVDGIKAFSPEALQDFLNANAAVETAAQFLEKLPREFKQHWIMMTRSESTQTGTATSPRFLLPSQDSSKVFGFALSEHPRFPLAHPEVIEFLHFEASTNKFRFHEIDMRSRTVKPDVVLCQGCHFGRPNWDAYDSWGGMLPFNRDRIYENSEEEKAVKRLLEDLQGNSIVMELELPRNITRDGNGKITIKFDKFDGGPAGTDAVTCDSDGNGADDPDTVEAFFMRGAPVSYPGNESVCVKQGGNYLTLHHSGRVDPDEGRGTALFDQFTGLNAQRVAQELLRQTKPVDIRPIALAIAKECVNANNLTDFAPQEALDAFLKYHQRVSQGKVQTFPDLINDTRERRESLPKKKADLQAENLGGAAPFGLIRENDPQKRDPNPETITQQVFRRSKQGFDLDKLTKCMIDGDTDGCMIDREAYGDTEMIALFRFFLEPPKVDPATGMEVAGSGVRVDTWSLSVVFRFPTYTFGDLFSMFGFMPIYTNQIISELTQALTQEGLPVTCGPELAAASKKSFEGKPPPPPPPGVDLTIDLAGVGCSQGEGLTVKIVNQGREQAEGFATRVDFILIECRENPDCPSLQGGTQRVNSLNGLTSTPLKFDVPPDCFSLDVPQELRGCEVFIEVDSGREVQETNERNNTIEIGQVTCGTPS